MIVLISLLCSCTDTVADFKVTNTTDQKVENFIIEPSGDGEFYYINIDPKESVNYKLDLDGVPEVDGNYKLSYQINGKNMQEEFGYYSNGVPLDGTIRIEILPITVRITPVSE
jgi:hypothetical protein